MVGSRERAPQHSRPSGRIVSAIGCRGGAKLGNFESGHIMCRAGGRERRKMFIVMTMTAGLNKDVSGLEFGMFFQE